jgi:exfoliative toxin A/B
MAVSGVALALAALGNLLLPRAEALRWTCGGLSAVIMCAFLLKLIFDRKGVKNDLKNPVVFSILPTSTMALMLLCGYAKPLIGVAADVIWYAATALHVAIMVMFTARFVIGFKLQNVFPSWFVAGVGITAASVTSPAFNAKPLGQALFFVGAALYLALIPLVFNRLIKIKQLPEPARPTLAIVAAPASLLTVAYIAAFGNTPAWPVYILLILSVLSYIFVTVNMAFLLRLKFSPAYAAFTFPYVISAIAFKQGNAVLAANGIGFFSAVPAVAEWIAIAAVVYVILRYIMFFRAKP